MSGSDGLVERLVVVARRLATDIVRARAVPLRRLHFELARELQLVPGALAAFEHDFQVIHPPVVAFCEVLHAHPHDQYDFDFSEAAHFDHCITVVDVWAKVRARGGDALVTAFERAGSEPIRLLLPLSAFGPKFLRLMGTAYHLQRQRGDEPIHLPVMRLGRLFGLADHTHVSPLLSLGRQHGLLIRVAPPSPAKRLAAEYRFNLASSLYLPPAEADHG